MTTLARRVDGFIRIVVGIPGKEKHQQRCATSGFSAGSGLDEVSKIIQVLMEGGEGQYQFSSGILNSDPSPSMRERGVLAPLSRPSF